MNNKNKVVTSILLIILLILVVGVSYATFDFASNTSFNTINSGQISFSYIEPTNNVVINNALPMSDVKGKVSSNYFEFTVTSNVKTNVNDDMEIEIPYTIDINKISVDSGKTALSDSQIKVYLTRVSGGVETQVVAPTLVSKLINSTYSNKSKTLTVNTHLYKANYASQSTTYRLRSWIDYAVNSSSWSSSGAYQYKFKVNVNATSKKVITKIISGDLNTVGSEVKIGTENFYVIGDNKDDSTMVNLLAKYNLDINGGDYIYNGTGLQDEHVIGGTLGGRITPWYGTIAFSSNVYWWDSSKGNYKAGYAPYNGESYPYVYDSNSLLYPYVENYKNLLESYNINISEARLLSYGEASSLLSNSSTRQLLYTGSFWLGNVQHTSKTEWGYAINTGWTAIKQVDYYDIDEYGVKPVITVSKDIF